MRKKQEEVINNFRKVHGDTYDYSKVNYIKPPKFHSCVQSKDFWMDNQKLLELGFKQSITIEKVIKEICL